MKYPYKIGETYTKDGIDFETIDPVKYAAAMQAAGAPTYKAEKSGYILLRHAQENEKIAVFTQNGVEEAPETAKAGEFIATKAGADGKAVVDEFGHVNEWKIAPEVLSKKYDVDLATVEDGAFVKPKGGEYSFIQVADNVAVNKEWGPKDSPWELQVAEKGGYLNVTDPSDMYLVSERDFADLYHVNEVVPGTKAMGRNEMTAGGAMGGKRFGIADMANRPDGNEDKLVNGRELPEVPSADDDQDSNQFGG